MTNIFYIDGNKIVEKDGIKYIYLPFLQNSVFDYLKSRNFLGFLKPLKDDGSCEIYIFQEDNVPFQDKAKDLILLLSLLHTKTTTYEKVVFADCEKFYQEIASKINFQMEYYLKLQEQFENNVYMAPDEYLFMRNASIFYRNLRKSREYLDLWLDFLKKEENRRVVFLQGSPTFFNFVDLEKPYFRDFSLSKRGCVVYDFLFFYKRFYEDVEMVSLFRLYQKNFYFDEGEKYLFYALLLFNDNVVDISASHYKNVVEFNKTIRYLESSYSFLLKQNEKDEKTDK